MPSSPAGTGQVVRASKTGDARPETANAQRPPANDKQLTVVKPAEEMSEAQSSTQPHRLKTSFVIVLFGIAASLGYWALFGITGTIAFGAIILVWVLYVFVIQRRIRYAEKPIPTTGWPRVMYLILQRLRIQYVPTLSLSEQLVVEQKRHDLLAHEADYEFAVIGPKGGVGKSTVATVMALLSAMACHLPTLVVDSRHKRGNIAERLGMGRKGDEDDLSKFKPRVTVTIRQAILAFLDGRLTIPIVVDRIIGSFPGSHLAVIASDIKGKGYSNFNVDAFRDTMNYLCTLYSRVFHEADNELLESLDIELMRRCRIPVFVTRLNQPFANTELLQALDAYRNYNEGEFRDKIDKYAQLVVLATRRRDTPEKYAKMFNLKVDQITLVPFDNYFEIPESEASLVAEDESAPREPIIDLTSMPIKMQVIYLRSLNSAMARHAEAS